MDAQRSWRGRKKFSFTFFFFFSISSTYVSSEIQFFCLPISSFFPSLPLLLLHKFISYQIFPSSPFNWLHSAISHPPLSINIDHIRWLCPNAFLSPSARHWWTRDNSSEGAKNAASSIEYLLRVILLRASRFVFVLFITAERPPFPSTSPHPLLW